MVRNLLPSFACVVLIFLSTGCGSLNPYPAGRPGWHSPHYSVVFGRLNRHGQQHPVWTLRYASATASDPFGGRFFLTPSSRMNGFFPGQQVEVYGHPLPQNKGAKAQSARYHVDVIRLWLGTGHNYSLTR